VLKVPLNPIQPTNQPRLCLLWDIALSPRVLEINSVWPQSCVLCFQATRRSSLCHRLPDSETARDRPERLPVTWRTVSCWRWCIRI